MKVFTFTVVLIAAVVLGVAPVLALITYGPVSEWPKSWPAAFDEYREDALQVEPMTGGPAEVYYEIPFENREAFERLWPAVLKVKTKGAPLTLRTFKSVGDAETENFTNRVYTKPRVTIYVPPSNAPRKIKPVLLPSGEAAEYLKWEKGAWHLLDSDPRDSGYVTRARTEVVLYVDGSVIDLNRIRLPEDGRIIDKRELLK